MSTTVLSGSSAVGWIFQINEWTNGLLMPSLIVVIGIILFSIMNLVNIPQRDSILATCWTMFLLASVGAFMTHDGSVLINPGIAVLFLLFAAISLIPKIMKNTV